MSTIDFTAGLWLTFASRFDSDSTFLTAGTRSITYGQLCSETARYANALRARGLKPGDRVAVQAEKSPEAIFLYLACLRAGFVYVPLNTAYTASEISYFLDDLSPALFVCDPAREASLPSPCPALTLGANGEGSLPALASSQPPAFSDPTLPADSLAALVYTSGTTGRSKGAMLTQRNLLSNAQALVEAWGITSGDVLLHALPLFHVHGLFVGLHTILLAGASLRLLPRFELEQVLGLLPSCTMLMGVPTFYTRLLSSEKLGRDLAANVRLFVSGSAPLLAETHREFERRTGHAILERYGMTETGMLCSNPLHGRRIPGAVGFLLPGVQLRLDPEGGIEVRGPNVFSGYWRRERSPADFTADGWFRTGDVGGMDEQGYVHILGRAKDLIISGGYNVYPKEVEGVLDELPAVAESAVVGVPHPDFGEAVVAVIQLKEGAKLMEQEALAHARTKLAAYKAPKRAVFRELPRNAMGKVQKKQLREELRSLFKPL